MPYCISCSSLSRTCFIMSLYFSCFFLSRQLCLRRGFEVSWTACRLTLKLALQTFFPGEPLYFLVDIHQLGKGNKQQRPGYCRYRIICYSDLSVCTMTCLHVRAQQRICCCCEYPADLHFPIPHTH